MFSCPGWVATIFLFSSFRFLGLIEFVTGIWCSWLSTVPPRSADRAWCVIESRRVTQNVNLGRLSLQRGVFARTTTDALQVVGDPNREGYRYTLSWNTECRKILLCAHHLQTKEMEKAMLPAKTLVGWVGSREIWRMPYPLPRQIFLKEEPLNPELDV